jgi:hypothetical protein
MYGVPAGLDLSFLHGAELIQIRLGVFEVIFCFHTDITFACSGNSWDLFDGAGACIDSGLPFPRPPYQLHRLLGQRVIGTDVAAPRHLDLIFESGERLRVMDTSPEYESFTITTETPRRLIIV